MLDELYIFTVMKAFTVILFVNSSFYYYLEIILQVKVPPHTFILYIGCYEYIVTV